MGEHRAGRFRVWTPLLFSFILIIGMSLGFNLRDTLRNKRDIQAIIQRNDRLEEIIDLINEKYVDTVSSNALYGDAITGILSHLDPHTVYIPSDKLAEVNEDLEGGFFGIGVEFSIIRDTIQVTSVIENGPAEHAGVETGDQLIKVNDSVVAGTQITSAHIMKLLKGKQHSRVLVTLRQPVTGSIKQVPIERDIVPVFSVDAGIMLDSITGFIKINRFSATTYDEFSKALKTLKGQGMKQLVLDLRDNPGGYLEDATMIADEFLDDKKLIVYTKGRRSQRVDYKASRQGMFEKGRLAVLVDESSASASEILAGAIQDWDRGILVGRRTYGKGLVQEQYEMEDGAALRLTIARYYTPSGRSIQRSFANGKEAYEEDFAHRFEDGELTGTDSFTVADTNRYYTSKHRLVYGGGGIHPDIYVPYDTSRLATGYLNMLYSEELKNTLWDYFIRHRDSLRFTSVRDYDKRFGGEQEIIGKYLASLKQENRAAAKLMLIDPIRGAYFRTQVRAQLARLLFRDNGYYYISAQKDNVVQRALQVLDDSSAYLHTIGG
jgi:carboxyl-terminal processing protease